MFGWFTRKPKPAKPPSRLQTLVDGPGTHELVRKLYEAKDSGVITVQHPDGKPITITITPGPSMTWNP